MADEANVTYQIFQPSESVPDEAIPQDKTADAKVVSVKTEKGPGLLFAEPEELSELSSVFEKFRVQGVVIPDYLFLELVSQSENFGCKISDVEFSDPAPVYKSTVEHLIKSGDKKQLHDFLQQLRRPISSIRCDYQGAGNLHAKLNGSGLVTLQGDESIPSGTRKSLLKQLTLFLSGVQQSLSAAVNPTV